MRQREDNHAFGFRAIDHGEREASDEHSSRILGSRQAGKWKRNGSCRCLFYGCGEAGAKASFLCIVVSDLREKLATCRRGESRAFHRARRRASANTSSAG